MLAGTQSKLGAGALQCNRAQHLLPPDAGATYPKEGVQEDTQDVLRPSTAPARGDASVEGEAGDAARQLMDSSSFQLSFSVVGL